MSNTKTEAQRLADEAARFFNDTTTYRTCNVSKDLLASMSAELRRLDAENQQLRAQLSKAVAEEREACIDIVAMHGGSIEIEAAIRARRNT